MSERGRPTRSKSELRPPRPRLVPPRLGEVERRTRTSREERGFTRALSGDKRRRFLLIFGNLLLFTVLIGGPWLRGERRARQSVRALQAFLGCLYGSAASGGLGDFAGEAEYFAGYLLRRERNDAPVCGAQLGALLEPPALFLLPSVKAAEARVREARAMLQSELSAAGSYTHAAAVPERALRALTLLRERVRIQGEASGIDGGELSLPLSLRTPPKLATPARLPLYAAPDADLSLTGDDQTLRIVALDATGLSYLELEPGYPFVRARLVRPRLLRRYVRAGGRRWLVWATPRARCAGRSEGCFGKTTNVAEARLPLLELPEGRALAAHVFGRVDRSLAATPRELLLVAASARGRAQIQTFELPTGFETGAALPPLAAARAWPEVVDDALLLSVGDEGVALGVSRRHVAELRLLSESSARPLASLAGAQGAWVAGCADEKRAGFVFGDGEKLVAGELRREGAGFEPRLWEPAAFVASATIDPERADRDRVVVLCTPRGVLAVARDAEDQLSAFLCRRDEARCRELSLARGVRHFSALEGAHGALVAYAGDDAPQIRVTRIDEERGRREPEWVPAACFGRRGLCRRPTLARLGGRVLLVAPERTDLVVLESADEGRSFHAPPVL